MSISNLPLPDISTGGIPAHEDVVALADGRNFVPDTALIARLANEIFSAVPGNPSPTRLPKALPHRHVQMI